MRRIDTYFFPVGEDFEKIVIDWIAFLKTKKLFGNDDPLFPRTKLGQDKNHSFAALGLEPVNWSTTASIRKIFKDAFEAAGLPYFSPHTFRHTLVQFGEQRCKTPEEFKAWSQNLGHESTLPNSLATGQLEARKIPEKDPGEENKPPIIDDDVMDSYGDFQEYGGAELITRLLNLFQGHASVAFSQVELDAIGGDQEALATVAHALKSMSRNIGAVRLSNACNDLEFAARQQQNIDPQEFIPLIKEEFERVKIRIVEVAIERNLPDISANNSTEG